ncbi:MFS transporter [Streptomyces sp. CA-181903]|uniref:MFS transporter n=1 Tax=Streptomyces sp. CA-181903 TaxID=3240055 RepID=UPI003D902E82
MVVLDGTIVSVALPSIQADLGYSPSGLAWVVNAYLVPFGGLLLLAGRVGDLAGRKRVFVTGLVLFTAASLLCGAATTPGLLLAARFLQGVGGAVTSAVTLGMVTALFPEPRERARAIGVYSFVQSAGGSTGLLAGGALTQALDWHWIFLVNLPVGVVASVLAVRMLRDDRRPGPGGRTDVLGSLLVTSALTLGVYAIVGTADHGWGSAHTLGSVGGALALFAGFAVRQARAADPLLPPRVLRSRRTAGALAAQALMVAGMFGFQFLTVLYLREVLHLDQVGTGLGVFPVSVVIGALSLTAAPRLIGRFGPERVLVPALVLIAAGLALLGRVPAHGAYATDVLPALFPLGTGFALAMPSLATLAMSTAAPGDSGIASGLFNTAQQVGAVFGLAVLSTLASSRTAGLLDGGGATDEALAGGYRLAFRVGTLFVLGALAVAVTVLRRRPADTAAERQEALVSECSHAR